MSINCTVIDLVRLRIHQRCYCLAHTFHLETSHLPITSVSIDWEVIFRLPLSAHTSSFADLQYFDNWFCMCRWTCCAVITMCVNWNRLCASHRIIIHSLTQSVSFFFGVKLSTQSTHTDRYSDTLIHTPTKEQNENKSRPVQLCSGLYHEITLLNWLIGQPSISFVDYYSDIDWTLSPYTRHQLVCWTFGVRYYYWSISFALLWWILKTSKPAICSIKTYFTYWVKG